MKIPCEKLPHGIKPDAWYASNYGAHIHVYTTKKEAIKQARCLNNGCSERFRLAHVDWIKTSGNVSLKMAIGGVEMQVYDHRNQ